MAQDESIHDKQSRYPGSIACIRQSGGKIAVGESSASSILSLEAEGVKLAVLELEVQPDRLPSELCDRRCRAVPTLSLPGPVTLPPHRHGEPVAPDRRRLATGESVIQMPLVVFH